MSNRFKLERLGDNKGIYTQVYRDGVKGIKGVHEEGLGDIVIRFKIPRDNGEYKDHKINVTKYYNFKDTKNLDELNKLLHNLKVKAKQGLSLKNIKTKITLDEAYKLYLDTRENQDYNSKDKNNYEKNVSIVMLEKITIGSKYIDTLNIDDFQKVVDTMQGSKKSYGTIKRVLGIVKSALRAKEMKMYHPTTLDFKELKFLNTNTRKTPIDERIETPLEVVSQALYSEIMKIENTEMRLFLLLTTQCVRRTGEVFQLITSDVLETTIKAREETTKANRAELYPISDEIIEAFGEHIKAKKLTANDRLFQYADARPYARKFTEILDGLINKGTIKINKPIYDETPYTQHDNRSLLAVLLNKTYSDDMIGKNALSHSDETLDGGYAKSSLANRKEVLFSYWNILRSNGSSELFNPTEHIETYYYPSGNLKSFKDGNLIEGYYEDSSPLYSITIDTELKPIKGVWYDENEKENICNRASYRRFGFISKS